MKRKGIMVALAILSFNAFAIDIDSLRLEPKPIYGKEALTVVRLLGNFHYRKLKFNDSLSSASLDRYIETLDNNRSFFLKSDIDSFEKYRNSLDDYLAREDVSPAFSIYEIFAKRYRERLNYVTGKLIPSRFDYTVNEVYESDRGKLPWARSNDELNEIWRKAVKSQALALKLAGKSEEEIRSILIKRYQQQYKAFKQFTAQEVFSTYMNSITEAYDPHTNYFSPTVASSFKESMSLSLEGIGARLQMENDYTRVNKIMPGGDAERSGKLHPQDYIVGVAQGKDGEMVDVVGWRLDEVVKLIKGPKGTLVRLKIYPAESGGLAGVAKEITLTRDKIKLEDYAAKSKSVTFDWKGKPIKLGVISLPDFYMDFEEYQKGNPDYRSTTRDVNSLIDQLKAEGVEGIVLDLRNNGGGALMEAINLTGLFIKDGPVVQVRSADNKVQVASDEDTKVAYSGPLVVLTNRFSASASEIFAGAIQDYRRGLIVGESTFGKGTVQRVQGLSQILQGAEAGELKYTFQKFYRITGSSTQNKGVVPDVKLPSQYSDKFSESANPNALPWDVIKPTSYSRTKDVNELLVDGINKSYTRRLATDTSLNNFSEKVKQYRKSLEETTISLNEDVRRKQMNSQKATAKLSPQSKSLPADELHKLNDEELREGLLILAEISAKLKAVVISKKLE